MRSDQSSVKIYKIDATLVIWFAFDYRLLTWLWIAFIWETKQIELEQYENKYKNWNMKVVKVLECAFLLQQNEQWGTESHRSSASGSGICRKDFFLWKQILRNALLIDFGADLGIHFHNTYCNISHCLSQLLDSSLKTSKYIKKLWYTIGNEWKTPSPFRWIEAWFEKNLVF